MMLVEANPVSKPKGEIVARALAGVIIRREIGNDPAYRNIRGLALESAIAEGVDNAWLHLCEEADAVLNALRLSND